MCDTSPFVRGKTWLAFRESWLPNGSLRGFEICRSARDTRVLIYLRFFSFHALFRSVWRSFRVSEGLPA